MNLSDKDLRQLDARGITAEKLETQLNDFRCGFPFLKLAGSAVKGNGIQQLDEADENAAVARWRQYLADGGQVQKFVPASGAASRMFKDLFAFVNGNEDVPAEGSAPAKLVESLDRLPFKAELDATTVRLYGMDATALASAGRYKDLIAAIIKPEGMNYGQLPKALLTFHRYADGSVRTSLEEQFAEGAQTAAVDGKVKVHFTVSANHRELFEKKISEVKPGMEKKFGVAYEVSMSEQKPATDTVAATPDNEPFRDENGDMVFRPGGHGALIENLNDLDSTVVFIKNIDNVVPDSRRESTVRYKEIIAGELILVHDRIEQYLNRLYNGERSAAALDEMKRFASEKLCIADARLEGMTADELAAWLTAKFERPLRVCGMVRNEGEPGGGPYLAFNPDGSSSPQILESSQIDKNDPEAMSMMNSATHFNPVDLVCYLRDSHGRRFNLPDYVDPATGFISSKSLGGRERTALELPALWNGAMS
ncbi:MAG: DUF4301 family protein, partial [Muribaculaceae bacterium]|nr:DUF4301 family protein [Muribaculaceae bacterium]